MEFAFILLVLMFIVFALSFMLTNTMRQSDRILEDMIKDFNKPKKSIDMPAPLIHYHRT